MASQGPLLAGVGVDDAAVGTVAWTTPENITADDNTRATRALTQNVTSHYLKSSTHGFSIPAGATIDGIVVEVDRSQSGTSPLRDNQIRLVKADGTIGATNKADTLTNWPTTPDVTVAYGSSSDLWGETWAPADINDVDFGAALAARNTGATSSTARVDFIRITVYYTAGAVNWTQQVDETLSLGDALGKGDKSVQADTVTLTDTRVATPGKRVNETLSMADARSAKPKKSLAEVLTLADVAAIASGFHAGVADSMPLTDAQTFLRGVTRSVGENIAFVDSVNPVLRTPGAPTPRVRPELRPGRPPRPELR